MKTTALLSATLLLSACATLPAPVPTQPAEPAKPSVPYPSLDMQAQIDSLGIQVARLETSWKACTPASNSSSVKTPRRAPPRLHRAGRPLPAALKPCPLPRPTPTAPSNATNKRNNNTAAATMPPPSPFYAMPRAAATAATPPAKVCICSYKAISAWPIANR